MLDNPKTLEDARVIRYGQWAGNEKGSCYDPARCAYEVYPKQNGWVPYQCRRERGSGPANLYCKQHAKKVK